MNNSMLFILPLSLLGFVSSVEDLKSCPKRKGVFPKPGSFCKSFYSCDGWKLEVKHCRRDQHFLPSKGYCVRAGEFPCPEGLFRYDYLERDMKRCSVRKGVFPKPGSLCKSFYACHNWQLEVKHCPAGQHFFPAKGYCVWPEEYPCLEKPLFKECPTPYGKYLKPGTGCKVFYDCCDGKPTEKICPGDLVFDHIRLKCEWPELYTCLEENSSKRTTITTSVITSTIPDSSSTEARTITKHPLTSSDSYVSKTVDDRNNFTTNIPKSTTNLEQELTQTTATTIIPDIPTTLNTQTINDVYKETSTTNDDTSMFSTDKITSRAPFLTSFGITTRSTAENERTTTDISTIISEVVTSTIISSPTTITSDISERTPATSNTLETSYVTSEPPVLYTDSTTSVESSTIFETTDTESQKELTVTSTGISAIITTKTSDTTRNNYKDTSFTSTIYYTARNVQQSTTAYGEVTDTETNSIRTNRFTLPFSNTGESTTGIERTIQTKGLTNDIDSTTMTSHDFTEPVTVDIFCPEPSGYFPHPTDKHKFVGCVGGIPSILTCPADLVYVHEERKCDYDSVF